MHHKYSSSGSIKLKRTVVAAAVAAAATTTNRHAGETNSPQEKQTVSFPLDPLLPSSRHVTPGQIRSGHIWSCEVTLGHIRSRQVKSRKVRSGPVVTCIVDQVVQLRVLLAHFGGEDGHVVQIANVKGQHHQRPRRGGGCGGGGGADVVCGDGTLGGGA